MSQLGVLKLPNRNSIQGITALINRLFNPKGSPASHTTGGEKLTSQGEFVKGINFNGKTVNVDGHSWLSHSQALASGLSAPEAIVTETSVKPHPAVNRNVSRMLNSVICKPQKLEIIQTLPNGSYDVYLWIMENYASNHHSMDVSLGGEIVARDIAKLEVGNWVKYGPYRTILTDGALNLALSTTNPERDAHLMGMAIFRIHSTEG
jgi:hypothetical protein